MSMTTNNKTLETITDKIQLDQNIALIYIIL